jgi:hypothetical protein
VIRSDPKTGPGSWVTVRDFVARVEGTPIFKGCSARPDLGILDGDCKDRDLLLLSKSFSQGNPLKTRPNLQTTFHIKPTPEAVRLSAVSGPSTYPANRDFKGHVGGVRGAAPLGKKGKNKIFIFSIFSEFFC